MSCYLATCAPVDWNRELTMLTISMLAGASMGVIGFATFLFFQLRFSREQHARWDRCRHTARDLFLSGMSLADAWNRALDIAYHNGVNTKWWMKP